MRMTARLPSMAAAGAPVMVVLARWKKWMGPLFHRLGGHVEHPHKADGAAGHALGDAFLTEYVTAQRIHLYQKYGPAHHCLWLSVPYPAQHLLKNQVF